VLLKRKVVVKSIVTEGLKKELLGKLEELIKLSEKRLSDISSEEKKFLLRAPTLEPSYIQFVKNKINEEKAQEENIKAQLLNEKERVKNLKEGEFYIHGIVEGFVEIKEGDDYWKKLEEGEIILKDGKVIEIKNE